MGEIGDALAWTATGRHPPRIMYSFFLRVELRAACFSPPIAIGRGRRLCMRGHGQDSRRARPGRVRPGHARTRCSGRRDAESGSESSRSRPPARRVDARQLGGKGPSLCERQLATRCRGSRASCPSRSAASPDPRAVPRARRCARRRIQRPSIASAAPRAWRSTAAA